MVTLLVTGASGFLAGYLLQYLSRVQNGPANIHGISRGPHNLQGLCETHYCDLQNFRGLSEIIKEISPNCIFHLAGSFSNNVLRDYRNNVLVTENLLNAIIKNGDLSTRVVVIGSSAEYGNVQLPGSEISEASQLNPTSVYGLTKVVQTRLTRFYFKEFGVQSIMARPFNIIGRGLSETLFVGRVQILIEKLMRGKLEYIELGNMSSSRDYVDVEDVVSALILLMERGEAGQLYNIGSGRLIKMIDLLRLILEVWCIPETKVRFSAGTTEDDGGSYSADLTKISELGWKPQFDIISSVKKLRR